MLQAYFDDSIQGGEVLMYAGWMAPTATWLGFVDDWQSLLDGPPARADFKMGRSRGGAGLTRAKKHYALIRKHGLVGVGCAVPIKDLIKVANEFSVDATHRNPYFIAWRAVFSQCFMVMDDHLGRRHPIEFIFDNQTEKTEVYRSWEEFMGTCPARIKRYVKSNPAFRDDKEVLPLQAADLLAWWARRQYLEDKRRMSTMFPEDWTAEFGLPQMLFAEMPEAALRKQFTKDTAKFPMATLKAHFKLTSV